MSICTQCGATFGCGAVDPGAAQPCWCTRLPALPLAAAHNADATSARCFCPDCLRALLAREQAKAGR